MNTNEKLRLALSKADKALTLISKSAWFLDANFTETIEVMEAGNAIADALALPRRNCDVGTAEEQAERFNDYCKKQGKGCWIGKSKGSCPIFKGYKIDCGLVWAQMPYEEVKE